MYSNLPVMFILCAMLKIISLNVKSLNSNVKRRLLFSELKALKAEVVFLQETHFTKVGNFNFAKSMYPDTFLASCDRKKAGVAIVRVPLK